MRIAHVILSFLATATGVDGFNVVPPKAVSIAGGKVHRINARMAAVEASSQADCGCGPLTYAGKPSDMARASNPRTVLASSSVMTLNGETTNMDDILKGSKTSLVVFLRSLG
jgi:hypothetical protein